MSPLSPVLGSGQNYRLIAKVEIQVIMENAVFTG